jgi:hypothetical protein
VGISLPSPFALASSKIAIELTQVLLSSRIPSTTDVIIFSASAWVGIVLFEGYRSFTVNNQINSTAE